MEMIDLMSILRKRFLTITEPVDGHYYVTAFIWSRTANKFLCFHDPHYYINYEAARKNIRTRQDQETWAFCPKENNPYLKHGRQ